MVPVDWLLQKSESRTGYFVGASPSKPHVNSSSMHAVYICMYGGTSVIRVPLHSKYLWPHAIFYPEKSMCSKITVTVTFYALHVS